MTTWIEENMTWIFSGIGVAVLGALVVFFKDLISRRGIKEGNINTPDQNISVARNMSVEGNIHIQQTHENIVSILTISINKQAFNRSLSEQKKDIGRVNVQEWGRKMSTPKSGTGIYWGMRWNIILRLFKLNRVSNIHGRMSRMFFM